MAVVNRTCYAKSMNYVLPFWIFVPFQYTWNMMWNKVLEHGKKLTDIVLTAHWYWICLVYVYKPQLKYVDCGDSIATNYSFLQKVQFFFRYNNIKCVILSVARKIPRV